LSSKGLGIWWVNYELLDVAGNVAQTELEGQRVALSKHLEGTAAAGLSVTVNPGVNVALEGTKIPFKIVARNDGENSRIISYKAYAVLGSSSGRVTKAEEVGSGNIAIGSQSNAEALLELNPFKAYTSRTLQSWAQNWWQFVFTDESGATFVQELRGVSVYKRAAKITYNITDETAPQAGVFKPGDKVRLDLLFENLIPVGYPVNWQMTVKTNNLDQKLVYQKSESGVIDPVIDENLEFTVPEGCLAYNFNIDFSVTSDGMPVPINLEQLNSPNSNCYQLAIDNFNICGEGINIDLHNKGNAFSDYTIICRFYSGGDFREENLTGTINALTTEKLLIPIESSLFLNNSTLYCFIVDPASGKEYCFSRIFKSKYAVSIKSVQLNPIKDNKYEYHYTIENLGAEVSGSQLKTTIKGLNISQDFDLPVLAKGQVYELSGEAQLLADYKAGTYQAECLLITPEGFEADYWMDSITILPPELAVSLSFEKEEYLPGAEYGLSIANTGQISTDVRYTVSIYDGDSKVSDNTGSSRLETGQSISPQWQLNPLLKTGKYLISWEVTTNPTITRKIGNKIINVKGAEAALTVNTGQPLYTPAQNVTGAAQVNNGSYPLNGNLNMAITKLSLRMEVVNGLTVGLVLAVIINGPDGANCQAI
jgi:hypothetical protein